MVQAIRKVIMSSSEKTEFIAQLKKCQQCLQDLEKNYTVQEFFEVHCKSFLQCLSDCLTEIKNHASLTQNRPYKNKILLCLSQVAKAVSLFRCLGNYPPHRQTIWYLCERLRWCFSELSRVLSGSVTDQDRDEPCDNADSFIHRIDLALEELHTHGACVPPSWKQLVDDLIYQAITIAKLASSIDYKEITSACQKLLEESSQLMIGDLGNQCQLSLLADSLAASLVLLEKRVNTAVLRLLLQVFSEPYKPLKKLIRSCGRVAVQCKSVDLDPLVTELDIHIERIILVGQFAVSCCEDQKRMVGLKCCLASVESMDNYLVPAVTAFSLSPCSQDTQQFVQLLCDHWQDELASFYSYLDAIIDSSALSWIVQESVSDLSGRLCKEEMTQDLSETIAKQCWLLYKHLSKSSDSVIDTVYLSKLKQAVHEFEAAISKQASLTALEKRVRHVTIAVDNIADQLCFLMKTQTSQISDDFTSGSSAVTGSIRDPPVDISFTPMSRSWDNSYRSQWLKKINCNAKKSTLPVLNVTEMAITGVIVSTDNNGLSNARTPKNERQSIQDNVFETPKTIVKGGLNLLTPYLNQTTERNTTLYVKTPRKVIESRVRYNSTLSESSNDTTSNSLDLEITGILESLSMLADTLSSEKTDSTNWAQTKPTPPTTELKYGLCGSSFDTYCFSLASVKTDEVSDVNTPERLQDIKDLDKKIETLKLL